VIIEGPEALPADGLATLTARLGVLPGLSRWAAVTMPSSGLCDVALSTDNSPPGT
jgi:hypothetical protein